MAVNYKELKNQGFMHQVQKNHFSLRLKVVGGNLTADQLLTIADLSKQYGDGYIHLTSRQAVEIPFIKLENIDEVKSNLEEGGVSTGVCGPGVRTVTACQGSAVCRFGCIDTYSLAVEVSERYSSRELPHKFKIGVTGCANNCLKAEENDIGIKGGFEIAWENHLCTLCGVCTRVCRDKALTMTDEEILLDKNKCINCGRCVRACPFDAWKGTKGYILSFGGTFGNVIAKGKRILPIITDKQVLFRVTDRALDFFDNHAKKGERFRTVIERVGWNVFKNEIKQAYEG